MITKLLISLMTLGLFFTACEKKETSTPTIDAETVTKSTTQKPQESVLTLTATDGKKFTLTATENGIDFEGLDGKVVLLDFFATWCPPCRAEMPHLVNLQNKYDGKIQILSILMEEEKANEEAIAFGKKYNLNFPILNCKENFLLSRAMGGIRSLPTLLVYDRAGNYFTHYTGAAPEEMIEADIKKALAK